MPRSAFNNAVSRTAGLLAIAILGIIILNTFNTRLGGHLVRLQIPPESRQMLDQQRIKLAGAEIPDGVNGEVKTALEQAIAQSFVAGFRLVMFIAAGLALVSALTAWLMIEGLRPKPKLVQTGHPGQL